MNKKFLVIIGIVLCSIALVSGGIISNNKINVFSPGFIHGIPYVPILYH